MTSEEFFNRSSTSGTSAAELNADVDDLCESLLDTEPESLATEPTTEAARVDIVPTMSMLLPMKAIVVKI